MQLDYMLGLVGLFIAGIIAGSINAVAGGGTLISFPSLVPGCITNSAWVAIAVYVADPKLSQRLS